MAGPHTLSVNTMANSGEWPQRLLHVESMTSHQRKEGDVYGGQKEPQYNILTYTWGRFALPHDGPALNIHGVEWPIPPINPRHFKVAEFEHVIRKSAHEGGVGWVWVDIACIDQRDDSLSKKEEVGRQASIFQKANHTYIWLCRLDTRDLQQALDDVNAAYVDISLHAENLPNPESREWWLRRTIRGLERLFSDPWFSSLWTLQEAFLRQDAFIMSKSGDLATVVGSGEATWFTNLCSDCSSLYFYLSEIVQQKESARWNHYISRVEEIPAPGRAERV